MTKKETLELVINQLLELNDTLPESEKFVVNEKTQLFGSNSNIDSLSLVSVIVDLEETLSSSYNIDISLTDDRAMTREISPFKNISTLVDYIEEIISEIPEK